MPSGIFFLACKQGGKRGESDRNSTSGGAIHWRDHYIPFWSDARMLSGSQVNSQVCWNLFKGNIGISTVLNTSCIFKTSTVPQDVGSMQCEGILYDFSDFTIVVSQRASRGAIGSVVAGDRRRRRRIRTTRLRVRYGARSQCWSMRFAGM